MNVSLPRSYMIENESDADGYLAELFENPEYRSMDEVQMRAAKRIKDARLRNYFLAKAQACLDNLPSS